MIVFLQLRIEVADKVVGIGFIGKNFCDVFERGDAGNAMFLIRSGLVDVLSGGPDSDAVVTLGPGDVFGEVAVSVGS